MKITLPCLCLFILNSCAIPAIAQSKPEGNTARQAGKETLPIGRWALKDGTSTDSLTLKGDGSFCESSTSFFTEKRKKAYIRMVQKELTGNWEVTFRSDNRLELSFTWIEAGNKLVHKKRLQFDVQKDLLADHHRY